MSITFQEAMKKIKSGIIVACPICNDGLEIDEANQRMYCEKHGDGGWVTPNAN